ncbi:glycosyltransferase [Chryseobacterium mulctrae]|uniref:glycosyltransferase n=1 Tax=Chryseobacterium mulctrae TaxID=2576777 RepID=UPI00138FA986|nr:glycosyltransferase [Chryseobacterium mulctrae]
MSDKIKVIQFDRYEPNINDLKKLSRKERIEKVKDFYNFYKEKTVQYLSNNIADICISTLFGKDFDFLPTIKDGSVKIAEFHFSYQSSPLKNYKTFWQLRNIQDLKLFYHHTNFIKKCNKYTKFIALTERDTLFWNKKVNNVDYIYNPLSLQHNSRSSLEKNIVVAVGTLNDNKNFSSLIDIWSQAILKTKSEWKLHIYGTGENEEKLRLKIINLGLEKSVYIFPPTKEIENVYRNASIFTMTSLNEGFSLVLSEAISFGLPAIAFDCNSGPSEIINDNESGFLIPLGNNQLYVEKLSALMNSKDLRDTMGHKAFEKSKIFDLNKIMEQWNLLFKTLKNNN